MKISLYTALSSLAAISCAGAAGGAAVPIDGGAGGAAVVPCSSDMQCGNSGACFVNRCVERLGRVDSWAVELTPPPVTNPPPPEGTFGSLVTELPGVSEPPVLLTASPALNLAVPFEIDSTLTRAFATATTVILTVPSRIPGRPNLSFQAGLALTAATTASAALIVSDSVLGQLATVDLIPSDMNTPPYTFLERPIPMSGPTIGTLNVPAASFKISGQLVNSLNAAKGSFTARAFQGSLLASTTAVTSAVDGSFTIYLPAGSGPVNLELLPSGAADPWMTLQQLPLTQAPKDLGPIALPAYATATAFRVTVHGNNANQTPVPGVSVRAIADLDGGDMRGKTRFLRDGSTDANGSAQLTLIPGDSQSALSYSLSVVPPPGSPWASQCVSGVPVLWNGSSSTTTIQDFSLVPRLVFSGTLLSADGAPVANAVVTATRGPSAATTCLPGPATTSVITDARGAFTLALDKGDHYQLDYDPPTGSPAPRRTDYNVSVNADVAQTIVRLPRPALFEGDVQDGAGKPVGLATIRIFDPSCITAGSCAAPRLVGQTQSDTDGHFRAIVGAPSAPN